VEVSTTGGHLVALGLGQAPYPLGGEPRDVLDDVVRMSGFAIAAHPDSAKPELRWSDWTVPLAGLEWLNADSEWRDEGPWTLLHSLLTYPARPAESVAALFDRPDGVIRRWDTLTQTRQVVAVAAADAHARIGLRSLGEPDDRDIALRVPSYLAMFRTFSIVLPDVALRADAGRDAASVLAAIEAGQLYARIDAVASPGSVMFTAISGRNRASAGGVLALDGPVMLRIAADAPPDAVTVLLRNGNILQTGAQLLETMVPAESAVYRVEIQLPGAPGHPPIPWMMSNPIYVGRSNGPAAASPPPQAAPGTPVARTPAVIIYDNAESPGGSVEQSNMSHAAIDVVPAIGGGRQLLFRYAVGGRLSEGPYAAIRFPIPSLTQSDRVTLTARADHPMRLSVQLRVPDGGLGQRWQRSIYLDETNRALDIRLADMTPMAAGQPRQVPLAAIDSLLFVVDTVNTKPGGSGTVWLDAIRFER
jgi:hypothetical protein